MNAPAEGLRYVDTAETLAAAASDVSRAPWAAVDCEADSLHHYLEKLCLLQISVPGADYVFDTLAPGLDFSPLVSALAGKPLVLHGADFDLRILRKTYGFETAEMFDTVIAAQLLGYDKQGYADLVDRHCGVRLEKSHQTADWSRRPLKPEQLEYAANDTRFLKTLRDRMSDELVEKGRLEWHRQACRRLLRQLTAERESPRNAAPWQLKGSKELDARAMAILKQLWQWRDELARAKDRPTFKVLHSETLVDLARWAAAHPGADAGALPGAPRNVRGEHRHALNEAVKRGFASEPLSYVHETKKGPKMRIDEKGKRRLGQIKAERDRLGVELGINPSLLATNATLQALVAARPRDEAAILAAELLLPWQWELLRGPLLEGLGLSGPAR